MAETRRRVRAIFQARIGHRLYVRNLVATGAGDILDGDLEIPLIQYQIAALLHSTRTLHKHATVPAVHA